MFSPMKYCNKIGCRAGPTKRWKTVIELRGWEGCKRMRCCNLYFCKIKKESYWLQCWILKLVSKPYMSLTSLYHQALSCVTGVETLIVSALHITFQQVWFCVGIDFSPTVCFSLFLTQKQETDGNWLKCVGPGFHSCEIWEVLFNC